MTSEGLAATRRIEDPGFIRWLLRLDDYHQFPLDVGVINNLAQRNKILANLPNFPSRIDNPTVWEARLILSKGKKGHEAHFHLHKNFGLSLTMWDYVWKFSIDGKGTLFDYHIHNLWGIPLRERDLPGEGYIPQLGLILTGVDIISGEATEIPEVSRPVLY